MHGRCASCDLTTATAAARDRAALLEAFGLLEAAEAARAEAARLEAAPCGWWWGIREERDNPNTGQAEERTEWACGKTVLPRFLNDQGHAIKLAVGTCQNAANGAERIAMAAVLLEEVVARHSERVEAAATDVAGALREATSRAALPAARGEGGPETDGRTK